MKKNLWKLFFGAMFAFAAMAFVGCVDDNEDTEAPYLEVSPTTLAFSTDGQPVDGGASAFTISTNRQWVATVEGNKSWVTLSPSQGNGSATVQVSIPENINDEATVKIQILNQVGPLKEATVKITSGSVKPTEVIYTETFGTKAPGSSPYPFVDSYDDFVKSGIGSSTVSYMGPGASLRSSGKLSAGYPGASGGAKCFFGANASFVVQKITLTSEQKDLRMTFGGSFYNGTTQDGEFKPEKFHYYLSADGVIWTDAISYEIDKSYNEFWVYATTNFTLKNAVDFLYVKFAADEASVFSMDDPTLATGPGGQVIDLGGNPDAPQVSPSEAKLGSAKNSTVTLNVTSATAWSAQTTGSGFTIDKLNGTGSGTITVTAAADNSSASEVSLGTIVITNNAGEKTVEVSQAGSTGNVYFYTNVGTKAVSSASWPTVANYDDWQATGSGASTVTFGGADKTTIRNSGKASTGAYDGASGPNVVFFGTLPAFLTVNNITVPSSQTNMKLTFGGSRSVSLGGGQYDNTFKKENFLVSLSADGTTWVPVTYTINNGDQTDPFWVFATADFTLKAGVSAIYAKFEATEASVFRLDDITLAPGVGGQQIDLGGGGSTPTVSTANYTNLKDVSVTLGGSLANADIANYTAVGVQYVTFSTGTVNDINWSTATKVAAGTKATPWTVDVTGLTQETQYAYRAYATPSAGAEIYGEAKTFVTNKTGGGATPITVPQLLALNVDDFVSTTDDRVLTAVVCGDPAGDNFSFGTLYVMTEGATEKGNAIVIYNNASADFTTANYPLGTKVKITLKANVAKVAAFNTVKQITGVTNADIEKNGTATVTPVVVTPAQLAEFASMPVTVQNASVAIGGVWCTAAANGSHAFTSGGAAFTVFVNKRATVFQDVPFVAMAGSISGIATISGGKGQLAPRNVDDVKAFNPAGPTIVSVDPTSLSFPAAGDEKTIAVTAVNIGANLLTVSGLSGILSATVNGTTVTVKANANTGSTEVSQTLTISLAGSSIEVPVTVAAAGGGGDTEIVLDFTKGVEASPAFPTSKQSTPPALATHTIDGYDWKFSALEAYYVMGGNKLLIGKQNSYVEFPAVAGKKLSSVEFSTPSGSSGKVTVGVLDASGNVVAGGESQTLAAAKTFTYTLTGTAVGTAYRLTVTNANNFQFDTITLIYK